MLGLLLGGRELRSDAREADGPRTPSGGSAEERYALQRWTADVRLTRVAAWVALLLHPVGGLTDLAIIGQDPRLVPLIAARIVASLVHIPIVLACAREEPPPWIERSVMVAFSMSVLAGVLLPTALRPTSVASQGGPLLLIIVLYALVFPVWRAHKVAAFMVGSAVYLAIGAYWRAQIDYGGAHELITMSIFLVAMGTLIPRVSRRIEQTEFDRFLAQDELTRTVEQLQQEVELRQERERALEEARERAEQANTDKTRFMASVSHELRTPLVGILGVAELMRQLDASRDPDARGRIELLRQSSDHLLRLVNDLLDYFKLEAGKLQVRREPVQLGALARTALELLKPGADEQGTELRLTLDPRLPAWIVGDVLRIQQIVLNLLSNAIKYSDGGHVELRLASEPGRSRPSLRIEVEDTGPGMEPSFVERMFEPFEQSGGTRGSTPGTGLGLTITQRLVEQMGGEIEVDSQPGRGTTMRVSLPLKAAEPPRTIEVETEAEAETEDRSSGAGRVAKALRVLLGEDNRINAMINTALLRQMGHEVTLARDGRELVERVTEGEFDIVLTDITMPVMDGVEATVRIRALPEPRSALPVLALTADTFEDRHAALRAAGLDDVLVKPISPQVLAQALERHTAGGGSGPS